MDRTERKEERVERRAEARSELKDPAYEIFIGVLSLLSIVNIVLIYVFYDDPSMQTVLQVMNGLFSLIFLGDFIFRMVTAEKASRYFFRLWGWADLLASLPLPQLKILRIFRLLRVYRLLRELGPRTVAQRLVRDRADSALMSLLLMGVLVLQFGSLAVLAVEKDAEGSNITTASDALWYTVVTISTVGYGDQYPVSQVGRLIGVLIIVIGVGIFGTFTGYLANVFLGPRKDDDAASDGEPGAPSAEQRAEVEDKPHPASRGVAAGAASGAVARGAREAADAAAEDELEDAVAEAAAREARLRELLARSEETIAEMRELLRR
ncbi:hypothetical protein GCM10022200_14570 [Microbacterium awajiense]|uniref:Ion transport domain-containing protein n=1 Tax=Microbacterium awajiense TaxID=415214 RepID=A0ABP7AI99_9MICO